jgi:uncharacterized protein (TIGR04255 family)
MDFVIAILSFLLLNNIHYSAYRLSYNKAMKQVAKISPSTILESIVEFRFNSNMSGTEIAFALKNSLGDTYTNLQELTAIPQEIREANEKFKFQPSYSLSSNDYLIRLGSNVLSIHFVNDSADNKSPDYPGWDNFSSTINQVLNEFLKFSDVTSFLRISSRYVNILEPSALWDTISLRITHPFSESNVDLTKNSTLSFIVSQTDGFATRVAVSSEAMINVPGVESLKSILDIETFIEDSSNEKDAFGVATRCHDLLRDSYFTILNEDYIKANYEVVEQ